MDAATKRRIDDARDILVGKVPDPKGQVEQITVALTYKFMGETDSLAEKMGGGGRTFFAGEFERYSWSSLLNPRLGGAELHRLYASGLESMESNPVANRIFRTIFRNAYLPYNDPTTLRLFLRVIDGFEFGNSELLGEAYEYLISIMGSQGKAGQFRTPRHIIEFVVDILDPEVGERILDPACGTSGFLIEAFRHVLGANTDSGGSSTLSTEARVLLGDSLVGYEIDPGMVKISLLNMYLHGMVSPQIFEYDTLTSEHRWDDHFDLVLANPPFMNPTGGVRPHSKFGIQSTRSEVLFVDYIAEHLTANGRAGIIVPEGVLTRTDRSHVALRKMLIEDWLLAVVSLPAGVFKPYSAVKTSVLVLDGALCRQSDVIGFFSADNDGFDLGDQRTPISDNDLPQIKRDFSEFKSAILSGEEPRNWNSARGLVMPKSEVASDPHWNLSAVARRSPGAAYRSSPYQMVKLSDICEIRKGTPITKATAEPGNVPVIASGRRPAYFHREANRSGGTITISSSGDAGLVLFHDGPIFASDCITLEPKTPATVSKFVYRCLNHIQDDLHALQQGTAQKHVYQHQINNIEVPLPPLAVQEEIVAETDQCQRVIDGAKMMIDNWRPSFEMNSQWQTTAVSQLVDTITPKGKVPKSEFAQSGRYPIIDQSLNPIAGYTDRNEIVVEMGEPLIVFGDHTCAVKIADFPFVQGADGVKILRSKPHVDPWFLYFALQAFPLKNSGYRRHFSLLKRHRLPVPDVDEQKAIASKLRDEKAIVESNSLLVGASRRRER